MLFAQVSVCSKGSLDGDEHSNEQQKALGDVGTGRRSCAVGLVAEWTLWMGS